MITTADFRENKSWNDKKRFSFSACLVCDGKWEEHSTLYEDEELRREQGKAVGTHFYPLADNPDIQAEFLRQLEEEAEAAAVAAEAATAAVAASAADIEEGVRTVSLHGSSDVRGLALTPTTMEEKQKLTLPKRDQPEKSVRLMQEQGMLRKYDWRHSTVIITFSII